MSWDIVVGAANLVTMACAVIGVILAAVLGWVAIHVAKSGNDTARKESLYAQVDDVLNAALALTAASSALGSGHDDDRRELKRAREGFDSRLSVLDALGLLPESRPAVGRARLFADALIDAAQACERLSREGRAVLSETLLSGEEDDHTEMLLARWIDQYCTDYRQVPDDFGSGSDVADRLRGSLDDPDWEPRASASLRLAFPWLQAALGVIRVYLVDGEAAMLELTEPKPEPSGPVGTRTAEWEKEALNGWLDRWSPGPVYDDVTGLECVQFSPEDMSAKLLDDLRATFLDEIVRLVSGLRTSVNEQHSADAGWMRQRLGLA